MAVTIKQREKKVVKEKEKNKSAIVVKEKIDPMVAVVDRLFELDGEVARVHLLLDPLLEEQDKLKKEVLLEPKVAGASNTEEVTLMGTKAFAQVSAKRMESTLSDVTIIRHEIGDELFFKIAKVLIGDLKKYVEKPVLQKIIKEEYTGYRTIKVKPK